jgi:hypothetical protein
LPIIAISGGGQILEAEFLDMALQLGATAALPNPFELAELLAIWSGLSTCLRAEPRSGPSGSPIF